MAALVDQERDERILAHVVRHRITVPEALKRLYFPTVDETAVTKVLARLTRAGHLQSFPLYPRRKYWALTPREARIRGVHPKRGRALGPDALVRAFGGVSFCCLGERARHRFTLSEFRERFPDLYHPSLPSSWYYVEQDGESHRLGFILVDPGTDTKRLARRCEERVAKRLNSGLPKFRDLILQGRFVVSIVTAYSEKARQLEQSIRQRKLAAEVRVEAHPALAHLFSTKRSP